MVKRPKDDRGQTDRLSFADRWRERRRRNSIRSRITVLILVPLIFLSGLVGYGVYLTAVDTLNVNLLARVESSIHLRTGELLDALQEERRASMAYLGDGRSADARTTVNRRQRATDQAAAALRRIVDADVLADLNDAERNWLKELESRLSGLDELREAVEAGALGRSVAVARFTTIAEACVGVLAMMTSGRSPHYGFHHQTLVDLQTAREALAQEDALLAGVLASGKFTAGEYDTFVRRVGAQRALFAEAEAGMIDPHTRHQYLSVVASDAFEKLAELEDAVVKQGRAHRDLSFTAAAWDIARTKVMKALRNLEGVAFDALVDHAQPVAIGIVVRLAVMILLGAIVVTVTLVLTWRNGRWLIRRSNQLKEAALQLAEQRLPQVVERLRLGKSVDLSTEAPPLEFGVDELGQVGRAFNEVQQTAVRAAVEQAELRDGTKQVIVNMARRSQSLVHQLLQKLDAMEKRTNDPADLEQLFAVDHLATRMRRQAEDLLILSGATPGRQWRKPVKMIDVIRSAVGEIEAYSRVDIQLSDPQEANFGAEATGELAAEMARRARGGGVLLAGRAVAEAIPLLAKLIENAAAYSPPETHVRVTGQPVPNGFVVEIEDRGLGMDPEELTHYNKRLESAPQFNPADTTRLGLFVVAHLAQRNGIRVHLRRSPYGGITAIVLIPKILLADPTPEDVAADATESPARPPAGRLPTPYRGRPIARAADPLLNDAGPAPRPEPGGPDPVTAPTAATSDIARPARLAGRPDPPTPERDPEPWRPAAEAPDSDVALPRRVRQASLAAELRETVTAADESARRLATTRTPEQIRAMMTRFQQETQRGRTEAEALGRVRSVPDEQLPSPRTTAGDEEK